MSKTIMVFVEYVEKGRSVLTHKKNIYQSRRPGRGRCHGTRTHAAFPIVHSVFKGLLMWKFSSSGGVFVRAQHNVWLCLCLRVVQMD